MSIDKDTFSTLFCDRVRKERERLGIATQQEAADRCGVSRKSWGLYERGEMVPGCDVLFAFAQLGANVDYLINGDQFREDRACYVVVNREQSEWSELIAQCPPEVRHSLRILIESVLRSLPPGGNDAQT